MRRGCPTGLESPEVITLLYIPIIALSIWTHYKVPNSMLRSPRSRWCSGMSRDYLHVCLRIVRVRNLRKHIVTLFTRQRSLRMFIVAADEMRRGRSLFLYNHYRGATLTWREGQWVGAFDQLRFVQCRYKTYRSE